MRNGFIRQRVLLILISILCTGAMPVVSAAEAGSHASIISHATPDQIKLINELWGSDITVGEYMEKVHPEHLVGVSGDVKKNLYEHKMIWPDGKSQDKFSELSRTITMHVSGWITKVSNTRIRYGGTSTVTGMSDPPGYIYIEAFLMKDEATQVDSTSASSSDGVYTISTENKLYMWPTAGNYDVHTFGYISHPYREASGESDSITIT